jgi:hypothetical protein
MLVVRVANLIEKETPDCLVSCEGSGFKGYNRLTLLTILTAAMLYVQHWG